MSYVLAFSHPDSVLLTGLINEVTGILMVCPLW
jgi:hypothetical protein